MKLRQKYKKTKRRLEDLEKMQRTNYRKEMLSRSETRSVHTLKTLLSFSSCEMRRPELVEEEVFIRLSHELRNFIGIETFTDPINSRTIIQGTVLVADLADGDMSLKDMPEFLKKKGLMV